MEWLAAMLLIREFGLACDPRTPVGRAIGAVHSASGQEAVAVGAMRALSDDDMVFGSHRSIHIALARGLDPGRVMAELFGKATGVSDGRGGDMHLRDVSHRFFGGNGVVGSAATLGAGAALAAHVQGKRAIALSVVGDGAMN